MSVEEQIKEIITGSDVVLFMKGSKDFPSCGFSQQAVGILRACGTEFAFVNVLEDMAIREGIKVFSDWPTIPQLYIRGEFVGGSDIMMEMYRNGDLVKQLGVAVPEADSESAER
jgi:monothiol glutaredoxin